MVESSHWPKRNEKSAWDKTEKPAVGWREKLRADLTKEREGKLADMKQTESPAAIEARIKLNEANQKLKDSLKKLEGNQ